MRSTDANEFSSRSHLVFMVRIETLDSLGHVVKVGKLTFIDLAGSERLSRIGVNPNIYAEGLSINDSLACLGHVINVLNYIPNAKKSLHDLHKLTQVMKDSLGGKELTLAIVNINPSIYNQT